MKSLNEWIYPELKHLPRWADRQAAMWAFQPRILRSWPFWIMLAIAVPLGAAMPWVIGMVNRVLPGSLSVGSAMGRAIVAGAIQALMCGLVFNYFFRNRGRRFLREYLNERGHNLCVECGYDLRGQETPRCPECGIAFEPGRMAAKPEAKR